MWAKILGIKIVCVLVVHEMLDGDANLDITVNQDAYVEESVIFDKMVNHFIRFSETFSCGNV